MLEVLITHNHPDEECFVCIRKYYQNTLMYIHLITRQTFNYLTPVFFDNNPQNAATSNPDNENHCVLTSKPVLRAALTLFESKEVQSAKSQNIFLVQEAGRYSDAS